MAYPGFYLAVILAGVQNFQSQAIDTSFPERKQGFHNTNFSDSRALHQSSVYTKLLICSSETCTTRDRGLCYYRPIELEIEAYTEFEWRHYPIGWPNCSAASGAHTLFTPQLFQLGLLLGQWTWVSRFSDANCTIEWAEDRCTVKGKNSSGYTSSFLINASFRSIIFQFFSLVPRATATQTEANFRTPTRVDQQKHEHHGMSPLNENNLSWNSAEVGVTFSVCTHHLRCMNITRAENVNPGFVRELTAEAKSNPSGWRGTPPRTVSGNTWDASVVLSQQIISERI